MERNEAAAHAAMVATADDPRTQRARWQQINAEQGLKTLQDALLYFKESDNRRTADRVRAAISSAKGAVRACGYRIHRGAP